MRGEHQDQQEREHGTTRRDFVKAGVTGAVGLAVGAAGSGSEAVVPPATPGVPFNERTFSAMPTRNLGRTGYRVGIFSLGGQATLEKPNREDDSVAIINRAIDLGVNYIDTAAAYGGPEMWSQKYIGKVMKTRRNEVFLTSKTNRRTYDESMRLLETSLKLLNTDHLDLWQLHNVAQTEQLDQIFAKDGAIHALEKAKAEKIVRFVGITGHADPSVLADGIKRFRFDTILMAVNAADRHHLSFTENLLPLALEQEIGIIGMKIPARSRILSSWTPPAPEAQRQSERATRSGTLTMREAMTYVLSLPVSTVIIGCDTVPHVEENVRIAREFTPLSERQMAALAERTADIKRQALFFRKWGV